MKREMFLYAAATALLAGCSSVSVVRDYDTSVDFSALHSFAWEFAEQPKTGNPRIDNDLIDERVRSAVAAQLSAKGFVSAGREAADFRVAYFIDYKQRLSANTVSFGVGSGGYGRYGGVGYNTAINDYEEGSLTIDIIDPATGKTIWRGIGRRTVYEGNSPARMTKVVNGSVAKILAKFPPKR